MHIFEVWAPLAESLAVQVNGKNYPMKEGEHALWSVPVADAHPGMDYGFVVNGEEPAIPDPRSPWQPNGVNGLSRVVDHASFQWSDQAFQAVPLASAVIYELHVGTFTPEGTLDAAINKLDYLKELGITHVELLPLAAASGKHGWGYDGVALFAPHQAYGGPDAVKRFVAAAHAKRLAVLHDVVYNHFGPSGNHTGKFGPYLNENHKTPWGGAVNLEEEGSDRVRRFFCDNALMWLRDYHFDGLRLDAVTAYIDRSAVHFLEQLADEVKDLGAETARYLVLIAESDLNDPKIVRAKEAGGYGVDAQWSDDFHHALWSVLTGDRAGYYQDFGTMQQLATSLEDIFIYQGQFAPNRKRSHGRPVLDLPGYRFLGYIQNHDQVGNRATGERLSDLVSAGRVKVGAALVMMAPSVPMVFEGEEFAASTPFQYFTDHEDKELGRLVSEGRKKEFGSFGWKPEDIPDPQDKATYERSKLKLEETTEPAHAAILDWYKKLIALRRSSRSLLNGRLSEVSVQVDEDAKWLIMQRGEFEVACNLGASSVLLRLSAAGTICLTSEASNKVEGESVTLAPDSVVIVRASDGNAA